MLFAYIYNIVYLHLIASQKSVLQAFTFFSALTKYFNGGNSTNYTL